MKKKLSIVIALVFVFSMMLTGCGASKEEAESSVRFSFSELTAEEEISCTLQVLREVVPQLRRFTRK